MQPAVLIGPEPNQPAPMGVSPGDLRIYEVYSVVYERC